MYINSKVSTYSMADYKDISPEFMRKIVAHYSRPEIQEAMICASDNKEVVGSFGGIGYAKRPDILQYPEDIVSLVNQGITSFHISEETWRNPLELSPGINKKELAKMRIGWDLLIDIDCPHWGISKLLTHAIVQEIKEHNVQSVTVKFSGNKGFHIGIAWESLIVEPTDFPEFPQKIARYLLDRVHKKGISEKVTALLLAEFGDDFLKYAEEIFKKPKDILFKNNSLDIFSVIEVDTLLISPRHLYRMVYSVNEKSGLVSLPINPDKILQFEKELAQIDNKLFSRYTFMNRNNPGDAQQLVLAARDFKTEDHHKKHFTEQMMPAPKEIISVDEYIAEQKFPESIKKMLAGNFSDGKKRMLFVLQHFLSSVGWTYDQIEQRLSIWNTTHSEPIRETVFKGQMFYLKQQLQEGRRMMPPNFDSAQYYLDLIGTSEDYKKAKNPVTLAKRRARAKS